MTPVRFSLALLLLGMGVSTARGQEQSVQESPEPPPPVVQRVVTAFTQGNPQRLLTPATDRVEVSLFGTRTFYSSAQAFYVLRDFFETRPPTEFTLGDVTEAGESYFVRGRYDHSRDEQTLQVYVRLVQAGQAWQLQEIRIDSDIE